jgi:hypothetical protein
LQHGKGGEASIKMVSPTQGVVERAKSNLNDPPTVYDPVSGVMQHTEGKHVKLKRKRKTKSSSNGSKHSKKRKIAKSVKRVRAKKSMKRVRANKKTSQKRSTKKNKKIKIKPKKKWWM